MASIARCAEVFVTDIAPAENGGFVVRDHRLVVHASIDAGKFQERSERLEVAARDRIEQPDLEVRVRAEREQNLVIGVRAEVVEQDPHAYAAVGRFEQRSRQLAARQIVVPDVVLQVERAVSRLSEHDARHDRVDRVLQQVKRTGVRMALLSRREDRAEPCRLRVLKRKGWGPVALRRQAGARGQHQDEDACNETT
jgi:hypothetical protein